MTQPLTVRLPIRTRLLMVTTGTNELRHLRGTSNSDPASSWAMRRLWAL